MCSLREQLAKMEQEVRLLKCEKQDTVETNANLLVHMTRPNNQITMDIMQLTVITLLS